MRARKVPWLAVLLAAACVDGPNLDNRACPCADDCVCDNGRCVPEASACPGACGDGVKCPGEACDDGDTNDCTTDCNATCSGPAPATNTLCDEPTVYFAEESLSVTELPPNSPLESERYELRVSSSNAYYANVAVAFRTSSDLVEGAVVVTPDSGKVVIPSGETLSDPIELEILRDGAAGGQRAVRVELVAASPATVGKASMFTLWVSDTPVPEVVRTVPTADSMMVAADTVVKLEFSVPMDSSSTSAAFGIEPTVEGMFSWENGAQTLVFEPETQLEAGETYVISVASEATSVDGITLPHTSFSFVVWRELDVAIIMSALSSLR